MVTISSYYIVIIPIAVGLITQALKFILYSIKNGIKWEYLFTHGHMPSSHTAVVISTLTSIGYYEGTANGVFALACIFAFIIIDDALRLSQLQAARIDCGGPGCEAERAHDALLLRALAAQIDNDHVIP